MWILRRLRGIIGTALVWGTAWAVAACGLTLVWHAWFRPRAGLAGVGFSPVLGMTLFYGIIGVWAGAVFASVLAVGDRRRTFAGLRMSRVVTWGMLGGVSYPVLVWLVASSGSGPMPSGLGVAVGLTAVLGGGSAAAMLALARRDSQLTRPGTIRGDSGAFGNPGELTSPSLASEAAVNALSNRDDGDEHRARRSG